MAHDYYIFDREGRPSLCSYATRAQAEATAETIRRGGGYALVATFAEWNRWARWAEPPCGDPRPDPLIHPEYWTE